MTSILVASPESSSDSIPVTRAPKEQGELIRELSRFEPRVQAATSIDRTELAAKTLAYIEEETKPRDEIDEIRQRRTTKAAKNILAS